MTTERPAEIVFRYGWPRSVAFAMVAMLAGLTIFLLVVAPGLFKLAAVAILILPTLFGIRLTRVGAHFRRSDLKLVRVFRTITIPWELVSRFLIGPRGIQPLAVYVEIRDGSRVWVEGVGPWFRFAETSPALTRIVHEMNDKADAFRSFGGPRRESDR